MNRVHLQQFLPNLHNWTSVNQLFQAQLPSSKRMEIWQTLRFTNKLWNEHNFVYGSSAKLFTICMKVNSQYALPVYGWWKSLHTYALRHCIYCQFHTCFYSLAPKINDKMHHKTLKHPLPQSLVHIIIDDIQRKNASCRPHWWQKFAVEGHSIPHELLSILGNLSE